jgi:hypothetical protein
MHRSTVAARVQLALFLAGCEQPPPLSVIESRTVMVDGHEHVEVVVETSPDVEVLLGTPGSGLAGQEPDVVGAGRADARGRVTLRARLRSSTDRAPTVRANLTIPMEDTSDNVFQQITVRRTPFLVEQRTAAGDPLLLCNFGGCEFGLGDGGHFSPPPPGIRITLGGREPAPAPAPAGETGTRLALPPELISDIDLATALSEGSPMFETTVRFDGPGSAVFEAPYRIAQGRLVRLLLARWKSAREPLALTGEPAAGTIVWVGGNGRVTTTFPAEVVGPSIPLGRIHRITDVSITRRELGCGAYRGAGGAEQGHTRALHDALVMVFDGRTGQRIEERSFRAPDPGCEEAIVAGQTASGGYVPESTIRDWLASRL